MLAKNDVHVFHTSLGLESSRLAVCMELLSADERERAKRYQFELHRHRFIARRSFLRSVLARYAGAEPRALTFELSEYGKPRLVGAGDLCFNLTHSADMAVCAVARRRVGVDIERLWPISDALAIAEGFFSPREVEALRGAAPAELMRRFFTCWTRKEAYTKADGRGMSLELRSFTVSLDPVYPKLLHVNNDHTAPMCWFLSNLRIPSDYLGSLAVECSRPRVIQPIPWEYPPLTTWTGCSGTASTFESSL